MLRSVYVCVWAFNHGGGCLPPCEACREGRLEASKLRNTLMAVAAVEHRARHGLVLKPY